MRLYSWNVNGIRAVLKKGFLDWLDEARPDILCLQETRATPDQVDTEPLEARGYHLRWHPAEKKGYSGVATLSRKPPVEAQGGIGAEIFDREGRLLITRHEGPDGVFRVVNGYFPNGQRDLGRVPYKLDFYRHLFDRLESWRAAGEHVVVCGDFNTAHTEVDLARPKQNRKTTGFLPEECDELDRWFQSGWIDTWRRRNPDTTDVYTWWSQRFGVRAKNVGWRIDYVVVNEEAWPRIAGAEVHTDVMGSDHCPISIEIS
jgi:exodeoxyribonuclease-3